MSRSYTFSPPCAPIGVLWDCFTFTFSYYLVIPRITPVAILLGFYDLVKSHGTCVLAVVLCVKNSKLVCWCSAAQKSGQSEYIIHGHFVILLTSVFRAFSKGPP
jgi:hypothetical protein